MISAILDLYPTLRWDLASEVYGAIPGGPFFGPGSPWGSDSLRLGATGISRVMRESGEGGDAFLNPPYSAAGGTLLRWHRLAWELSCTGRLVVVLCPPHPGRGWWRRYGSLARARIWPSRINFLDPTGGDRVGNTQDSALFEYRGPSMVGGLEWL